MIVYAFLNILNIIVWTNIIDIINIVDLNHNSVHNYFCDLIFYEWF